MSDLSNAWEAYVAAADAAGARLATVVRRNSNGVDVHSAITAAGYTPTIELVEYFSLVTEVDDGQRIFRVGRALGLDDALAEREQLTEWATTEAPELETTPDELFPERFFPVISGKPTISVDLETGEVFSWWWDEPTPRLEADSLASWLDRQRVELISDPDQAQNFFAPERDRNPKVIGRMVFVPGEVWLKEYGSLGTLMRRALDEGRRLVVCHEAAGARSGYEGLEQVQAEVVVKLLVSLGADPDRISLRTVPGDSGQAHVVDVVSEYVD